MRVCGYTMEEALDLELDCASAIVEDYFEERAEEMKFQAQLAIGRM